MVEKADSKNNVSYLLCLHFLSQEVNHGYKFLMHPSRKILSTFSVTYFSYDDLYTYCFRLFSFVSGVDNVTA